MFVVVVGVVVVVKDGFREKWTRAPRVELMSQETLWGSIYIEVEGKRDKG